LRRCFIYFPIFPRPITLLNWTWPDQARGELEDKERVPSAQDKLQRWNDMTVSEILDCPSSTEYDSSAEIAVFVVLM
jgi:hypothetical protein